MDVIRRVLRSRKKQLLSLDNVIGVGLGYKSVRDEVTERKSIVVIVEKKVPSDELRRRHVVPPFWTAWILTLLKQEISAF